MVYEFDDEAELGLLNTKILKSQQAISQTGLTQNNSREVVQKNIYTNAGYQELALRLKDIGNSSRINQEVHVDLYLGRTKTFEKGKEPDKYNVLVPLILRCFNTPNRDPQQAITPRKGWIYIVRESEAWGEKKVELWRELYSQGDGTYSDVNLHFMSMRHNHGDYINFDHRKETGQSGFRIIVPYMINQQVHNLWIAYSEVQWSWKRIVQMCNQTDSSLRDQRMHKLNLKNFVDGSSLPHATITPDYRVPEAEAEIYSLLDAPDKPSRAFISQAPAFKDNIPVVYLDDPVGIAKQLACAYQAPMKELHDEVELMKTQNGSTTITDGKYHPTRWLDSALILNTYLSTRPSGAFNEYEKMREENEAIEVQKKQEADTFRKTVKSTLSASEKEAFYKRRHMLEQQSNKLYQKRTEYYAANKTEIETQKDFFKTRDSVKGKLNPAELNKALHKEEREKIRQEIPTAKSNLIDFLTHELCSTTMTPLVYALDDYFTLTRYCPEDLVTNRPSANSKVFSPQDKHLSRVWPNWRIDAWDTMAAILGWIGKTPYSWDYQMEPNIDEWQQRIDDGGCALLKDIADINTGYAIHYRLFPGGNDKNPTSCENYKDTRPGYFETKQFLTFDKPGFAQKKHEVDRVEEESSIALQRFVSCFNDIFTLSKKDDKTYNDSIDRCQQAMARMFTETTGITILSKSTPKKEVRSYLNYTRSLVDANRFDFPEYRKLSIFMNASLSPKVEEGVKLAEEAFNQGINEGNLMFNAYLGWGKNRGRIGKIDNNGKYVYRVNEKRQGNRQSLVGQEARAARRANSNFAMIDKKGNYQLTDPQGHPVTGQAEITQTWYKSDRAKKKATPIDLSSEVEIYRSLNDAEIKKLERRINRSNNQKVALSSFMTYLEVVNVFKSIQSGSTETRSDMELYHILDILDSSLSLLGSLEAFVKDASAAGGREIFKKGTKDITLTKSRILGACGVVSTAMDVGFAFNSLLTNLAQNDKAGIGDCFIIAGGLTSILSSLTLLAGPFGIVGTGVTMLGYALKVMVFPELKPVELWATNGPYGEKPFGGNHKHGDKQHQRPVATSTPAQQKRALQNAKRTGNTSYKEDQEEYRYAEWCENVLEAYKALNDAIYRPTISITPDPLREGLTVNIHAPLKSARNTLTVQFEQIQDPWYHRQGDNKRRWTHSKFDKVLNSPGFDEYSPEITTTTGLFSDDQKQETKTNYQHLSEIAVEDSENTFSFVLKNLSDSQITIKARMEIKEKEFNFPIPLEQIVYDTEGTSLEDNDTPENRSDDTFWIALSDSYTNRSFERAPA